MRHEIRHDGHRGDNWLIRCGRLWSIGIVSTICATAAPALAGRTCVFAILGAFGGISAADLAWFRRRG
jgi:hypothetical protein